MEFGYIAAPPALANLVKTIWYARGTREEFDHAEPIVPDGCVELIFNLADPFEEVDDTGARCRQPRDLLVGPTTHPTIALPSGAVDLIGVRLWPGRTSGFLRTSMSSLADRLISMSSVLPRTDRLLDDLTDLPASARVNHLATELAARVRPDRFDRSTVTMALDAIERSRGKMSIAALASMAGVSRRHLERQFRDEVGLSAKQMARITRVQEVLGVLSKYPSYTGADIAACCGYSDQAHLIRECKELTGSTPSRLMTTERTFSALMRFEVASRG